MRGIGWRSDPDHVQCRSGCHVYSHMRDRLVYTVSRTGFVEFKVNLSTSHVHSHVQARSIYGYVKVSLCWVQGQFRSVPRVQSRAGQVSLCLVKGQYMLRLRPVCEKVSLCLIQGQFSLRSRSIYVKFKATSILF